MIPLGQPKKSLLSGLGSPDVSAFAKGRAMGGAAENSMTAAQQRQEMQVDQANADSQRNQRQAQVNASRLGNEAQERMGQNSLATRQNVFNIGMNFDYAALQRRRQMNLQQALLQGAARDF